MENSLDVKKFYEEHSESDRETRMPLEFMRTREIISRYLTRENMNIADVAGGTGVYSFWLAGLGHQVHLLDLAQNQIDYAKKQSLKTNVMLASYTCSDARHLPYDDESLDIVLLMGALYHLQERNDRLQCLSEAKRVLKTNGVLLCTYISRYAAMIGYYKWGNIDNSIIKLIDETLTTGKYENIPWFTYAVYHTPDEIISEISDSHFSDPRLIAVEGFANAYDFDNFKNDEYKLAQLLRHIEMTETKPELLGVSKDIIAVGVKR